MTSRAHLDRIKLMSREKRLRMAASILAQGALRIVAEQSRQQKPGDGETPEPVVRPRPTPRSESP